MRRRSAGRVADGQLRYVPALRSSSSRADTQPAAASLRLFLTRWNVATIEPEVVLSPIAVLKGEPAYSRARLRNDADTFCVCPTILKEAPSGDLRYAAGAIFVKPRTTTKEFLPAGAECFASLRLECLAGEDHENNKKCLFLPFCTDADEVLRRCRRARF